MARAAHDDAVTAQSILEEWEKAVAVCPVSPSELTRALKRAGFDETYWVTDPMTPAGATVGLNGQFAAVGRRVTPDFTTCSEEEILAMVGGDLVVRLAAELNSLSTRRTGQTQIGVADDAPAAWFDFTTWHVVEREEKHREQS